MFNYRITLDGSTLANNLINEQPSRLSARSTHSS